MTELTPAELRLRVSPSDFAFETTADLPPSETILGQPRAVTAIRTGLGIPHDGYNIFLTGLAGTGRRTTVQRILAEVAPKASGPPDDLAYVHSFASPDAPKLLRLPAGQARKFQTDLRLFITTLQKAIRAIFDSEAYGRRKRTILAGADTRRAKLIQNYERQVQKAQFALVGEPSSGAPPSGSNRYALDPIIGGKPVDLGELEDQVAEGNFPKDKFEALVKQRDKLAGQLETLFGAIRTEEAEAQQAVVALDEKMILPQVQSGIAELKEKYDLPTVHGYLGEVQAQLMTELDRFYPLEGPMPAPAPVPPPTPEAPAGRRRRGARGAADPPPMPESEPLGPMPETGPDDDDFWEYDLNIVVDHSETVGAPVVFESNPTYTNLFGTIERGMVEQGIMRADYTQIKAGSLLRANGGYLVLNALDLLTEGSVYPTLKRFLRNRRAEIQSFDPFYNMTVSTLKPESVELRLKVIVIGDEEVYETLWAQDEDFARIFKIRADFDTEMPRVEATVRHYAAFLASVCRTDGLLPFDRSGVAEMVEFGVRLAGRQTKLSTRFSVLADLSREADYAARQAGHEVITGADVVAADRAQVERSNLAEEKYQELIAEGTLLLSIDGEPVVGQVNGLVVYDLGTYAFGLPARITAATSLGPGGVVDIERESELSGAHHTKGVLIITGYLRRQYGHDKPLALAASLAFEQSYVGVDGDSASAAELCALLSSLAELPVRQDLAITGSVNQRGDIQPIGGVNEKIEGFFHACRERGLTGTQGAIIPKLNTPDLMLRPEVVEAVAAGQFHLYAVDTVDEAVSLLTGTEPGARLDDGGFPDDSVNGRVDARLRLFARESRLFPHELRA